MCPRCRQDAPLVYRGLAAYCSACGTMRVPLTGDSVNMAGRPSKVGGAVAKVIGWIVLVFGLSVALLLGLFFQWLLPAGFAGFAVGGVIAFFTATIAYMLLRGGKSLQQSGADEAKFTRTKAIFGLAAHRGGVLTAMDAATALGMRPDEADNLLTELAKTTSDQVSLELDDSGGIYYRFPALLQAWQPATPPPGGPVRVDTHEMNANANVNANARPRVATAPATPPQGELLEVEIEPPPAGRTSR